MAGLKYLNRCAWTAGSGGTDDFTFDAAKAGFYAPNDCADPAVVSTAKYNYFAVSDDGTEHEEGVGVFTISDASTLTRAEIRNSSNSGSIVDFTAPPTIYMGGPTATTMATAPLPVTITTTPDGIFFDNNSTGRISVLSQQGVQAINTLPELYTATGPWAGSIVFQGTDAVTFECDVAGVVAPTFGSAIDVTSNTLLTTVSMPDLEVIVGGTISFDSNSQLETINLPSLRYTGNIDFDFSQLENLTTLDISALERAPVSFSNSDTWTDVSLPNFMVGTYNIQSMNAITEVDLPLFVGNGAQFGAAIDIESCPLLETISVPSYAGPGGINLFDLPSLVTFACGGTNPSSAGVNIEECPSLTTVDLSTATALGEINLQELESLTTLDTSNLALFGSLSGGNSAFISSNPLLTAVEFPALTLIDSSGGSVLFIQQLEACTTVDVSALESGNIEIDSMPLITSLDFAAYTATLPGGITLSDMPITSLDLSAFVGSDPDLNYIDIEDMSSLTSLDVSNMVQGDLAISDCDALASLDASSMVAGGISADSCAALTTITFPTFGDNPNLTINLSNIPIGDLDFSTATALKNVFLQNLSNATSADFSGLLQIGGFALAVNDNPSLTEISFPVLQDMGGAQIGFQSCDAVTNIDLGSLETMGSSISIAFLPSLTTIDLSSLESVSSLFLSDFPSLTSLDLSSLLFINDSFLSISQMPLLTSLDISALQNVAGDLSISDLGVTTVSAPSLFGIGGTLGIAEMGSACTTVDLSNTPFITGDTKIFSNSNVTTINLAALTATASINLTGNFALTTVTLTALSAVYSAGIDFSSSPNVTSTGLTSALTQVQYDVLMPCSLPEAEVDNVLVLLAALDGSGGTTAYNFHTVDLTGSNAPPSATGLAAKSTLEGRGCTVLVNS